MRPATRDWLEGLRGCAADQSTALQPATPAEIAAERAVLAAHLATWLDTTPRLFEARRAHARAAGPEADPDPAIVLTTSLVGIAVAAEMLARHGPLTSDVRARIACTTEAGYRGWCMRHPDDAYLLHVNHWTWIKTRVPERRQAEFARHPLRDGQRHWIHRTGTAGAGAADHRAAHVWRFDGMHAVLLEAFVTEAGVRPPRA